MNTNEIIQMLCAIVIMSGILLYSTLAIIGRKKIIKDGWAAWYFGLGQRKNKEDEI